jgi:hypothetical protein
MEKAAQIRRLSHNLTGGGLRHQAERIRSRHRTISLRSGPTLAKPSGDDIPLGGFVVVSDTMNNEDMTVLDASLLIVGCFIWAAAMCFIALFYHYMRDWNYR